MFHTRIPFLENVAFVQRAVDAAQGNSKGLNVYVCV